MIDASLDRCAAMSGPARDKFMQDVSSADSSALNSAVKDTRKQDYSFNKLHKRLRRNVGKAIADFAMICLLYTSDAADE